MRLAHLLLLTLLLGVAACETAPQKTPPEDCPGALPEQETDGGIGGTGYGDCPDTEAEPDGLK